MDQRVSRGRNRNQNHGSTGRRVEGNRRREDEFRGAQHTAGEEIPARSPGTDQENL